MDESRIKEANDDGSGPTPRRYNSTNPAILNLCTFLTMKLSKTEQALLDRIDKDAQKTTSIMHGYRTGRKNGSYGAREHNAMISLRDKGIIVIVKHESFVDSRNLYSDHWSECIIKRT
jgi:hypothetical protein